MATVDPTSSPGVADRVKNPTWAEAYRRKVMPAGEALRLVKSGDRVYIHPERPSRRLSSWPSSGALPSYGTSRSCTS